MSLLLWTIFAQSILWCCGSYPAETYCVQTTLCGQIWLTALATSHLSLFSIHPELIGLPGQEGLDRKYLVKEGGWARHEEEEEEGRSQNLQTQTLRRVFSSVCSRQAQDIFNSHRVAQSHEWAYRSLTTTKKRGVWDNKYTVLKHHLTFPDAGGIKQALSLNRLWQPFKVALTCYWQWQCVFFSDIWDSFRETCLLESASCSEVPSLCVCVSGEVELCCLCRPNGKQTAANISPASW